MMMSLDGFVADRDGSVALLYPDMEAMRESASFQEAIAATGGQVLTVGDAEIVAAWRTLAQEEGLFCEPASAASVAGLTHARLAPGTRVVCVLTGHGLKDTGSFDELIASG